MRCLISSIRITTNRIGLELGGRFTALLAECCMRGLSYARIWLGLAELSPAHVHVGVTGAAQVPGFLLTRHLRPHLMRRPVDSGAWLGKR